MGGTGTVLGGKRRRQEQRDQVLSPQALSAPPHFGKRPQAKATDEPIAKRTRFGRLKVIAWNIKNLNVTKATSEEVSEKIQQHAQQGPALVVLFENKAQGDNCVKALRERLGESSWEGGTIPCGGLGRTRENLLWLARRCDDIQAQVAEIKDSIATQVMKDAENAETLANSEHRKQPERAVKKVPTREQRIAWFKEYQSAPWYRAPVVIRIEVGGVRRMIAALHAPGPKHMLPEILTEVYVPAVVKAAGEAPPRRLSLFVGDFNLRNPLDLESWGLTSVVPVEEVAGSPRGTTQNRKGERTHSSWDQVYVSCVETTPLVRVDFPSPGISDHALLVTDLSLK